jgi:hypothetical protein
MRVPNMECLTIAIIGDTTPRAYGSIGFERARRSLKKTGNTAARGSGKTG